MIRHTKTLSLDARVRIFWTLASVSLALLVIYIYAVTATIHNTVSRETLQGEASSLATHISEMEFTSITLKNNVNLDLAIAHGFKEVATPLFITRSDGRSLSMNVARR